MNTKVENPIKIVQQLRMVSGGNAKLKVLKEHSHNEDWKKVLVAMYDTSINYYITKVNDMTMVQEDIDVNKMMYALGKLSDRTYTGNAARELAVECSMQYGMIFRLILEGTLKSGVSVKTINKAYPGLIPEYVVMKGKPDIPLTAGMIGSLKYDGVRVSVTVSYQDLSNNGELIKTVIIQTSHGKKFRVDSLSRIFDKYVSNAGVYEGELIANEGKLVDRSVISAEVTKCIRGTQNDITKVPYKFAMFDYITLSEWETEDFIEPYTSRLESVSSYVPNTAHTIIAKSFTLEDPSKGEELFQKVAASGWEGLMFRHREDPYIKGRTDRLVKLKAVKKAILKCVGTTNGKEGTANEGLIGGLKCIGNVEGSDITVTIGGGLSNEDRFQDPDHFIGKSIEVLYNSLTVDSNTGAKSLFIARKRRVL